jgi:hypothetical protein
MIESKNQRAGTRLGLALVELRKKGRQANFLGLVRVAENTREATSRIHVLMES